ncbi:MAG: MgtC/SapB family protein [Candidatus Promineofilum sp.]|nr:MgtC/SapB family protein [Promineifilum sp.]
MDIEPQLQLTMGLRLVVAALLGGVIGLERERRGHPAGVGTFAMVTMGACAFSLISDLVFRGPDNTRIASGVVEGIGFLGGGIIIRGRAGVQGLTTAATLWTSAAIGMLIGFGLYFLGLVLATITLIVLVIRAIDPVASKLEELREEADPPEIVEEEDK